MSTFETYETVDVSDDAAEVADRLRELFGDPAVIEIVAVGDETVTEFTAADVDSIVVTKPNHVEGLVSKTPPIDEVTELRIKRYPWLTDLIETAAAVEAGDTIRLQYDSRFGNVVDKEISVEEAYTRPSDNQLGVDMQDGERVYMVGLFGYHDDADYSVFAQSNGGSQILMNDTKVIEPGTAPRIVQEGDDES